MPFADFSSRFPQLALKECRAATLSPGNHFRLPPDQYAMLELYCDEPNCDCRRVLLRVVGLQRGPVATVNFGWEPLDFYAGYLGEEWAKELQGPNLLMGAPQSELAPQALEVAEFVLSDPDYVERCVRHYRMFRGIIDGKTAGRRDRPPSRKVSRAQAAAKVDALNQRRRTARRR